MTDTQPPVYNGRYELRNQVARGGTAQVYLARDLLLDRPVALKVLFPELSSDPTFVERFRREAQAAANLSHPNIVPVFDWGESDRTYFIVMEYVDGEPLSSIIRTQGPLAAEQAAKIASEIAKALSYAHRHGVVHRDVKPGNVLITQDGEVKVTDFGIARAIGTDEQVTQTGLVMGTATYFSPEQAQGLGVDGRSDVYSLGVVLFEMTTGRAPFSGDSPVSIAYQHVREQAPTPRSINPTIPVALEAIISQAMAKLPAERYATAEDMRADLDRFVRGQTVMARPPSEMNNAPDTAVVAATEAIGHVGNTTAMPITARRQDRRRTTTARWAIAGVVLVIAIVAVVAIGGRDLGYFGGKRFFAVPDVEGLSPRAAASELSAKGLDPVSHTVTGNPTDANTVIAQNPSPPTSVRAGATVNLTVAGPAPTAAVPSVTGLQQNPAEQALKAAGFKYKVIPLPTTDPNQKQGQVIKQSPGGGAIKDQGTTVKLTVSESKFVPVPSFANENEGQAGITLGQSKLTLGTVTSAYSSTVANGDVISSNPATGSSVLEGTAVNLVVSQGAGDTVPPVLGDTESAAIAAIQAAGLNVVKGAPYPTQIPSYVGNVAFTRPRAGTTVVPGTTVQYRIGVGSGPLAPTTTTTTTTTTLPGASTTSSTVAGGNPPNA